MKKVGLMLAVLLALGACNNAVDAPEPTEKEEFTLTVRPGTSTSGAAEKFKRLLSHCPGIRKYREDVLAVQYQDSGPELFSVHLANPTRSMPAQSYSSGHVCHFSVSDDSANVAKRPCAWLCTGEDMTGIDGNDHAYANGALIGPKVKPWENLKEAIFSTRTEMSDVHGESVSDGAAKLAVWGAEHMRWAQLQEVDGTKYGLVMKDSYAQRGKRLCVAGEVIEIAVDRSVPGHSIHLGGLFDNAGHLYRFVALRSTGDIVAGTRASMCGIVTGQQHYPNSIGGVAHAVHMVGMFNLPENLNLK